MGIDFFSTFAAVIGWRSSAIKMGSPVKIRRYPRSCKLQISIQLLNLQNHCSGKAEWEGIQQAVSQKTCQLPVSLMLSGERHEM